MCQKVLWVCEAMLWSVYCLDRETQAQECAGLGKQILGSSNADSGVYRHPSVPIAMQTPSRPMRQSTLQTPEKLPQVSTVPHLRRLIPRFGHISYTIFTMLLLEHELDCEETQSC